MNPEQKKIYDKAYNEKHKDRLRKIRLAYYHKRKASYQITCECGAKINRYYLNRHVKTKGHKRRLEIQQMIEQLHNLLKIS